MGLRHSNITAERLKFLYLCLIIEKVSVIDSNLWGKFDLPTPAIVPIYSGSCRATGHCINKMPVKCARNFNFRAPVFD